jgi:hypothetical protein
MKYGSLFTNSHVHCPLAGKPFRMRALICIEQ